MDSNTHSNLPPEPPEWLEPPEHLEPLEPPVWPEPPELPAALAGLAAVVDELAARALFGGP